jgi:hypothetical protein
MTQIVPGYSLLVQGDLSSDVAEYALTRTINGVKRIYFIYFIRDPDGVWRLDSM